MPDGLGLQFLNAGRPQLANVEKLKAKPSNVEEIVASRFLLILLIGQICYRRGFESMFDSASEALKRLPAPLHVQLGRPGIVNREIGRGRG